MAANAKAANADLEDADAEAAPEQQPKRKLLRLPSLKWLIVGAAALAVVALGGGGAYYFLFAGHASEGKVAAAPAVKPPVFVDLPEVLVNLSGTSNDRTHYLKMKIVLELPEQAMVAQIQPVMPRVLDAFQVYLRELRPSDLDGSAGLYRMKEELTRRINVSIAPSRITAVLFKEIVIQ
jgi:flagellar protein FliL